MNEKNLEERICEGIDWNKLSANVCENISVLDARNCEFSTSDNINHPEHYISSNGLETIDVIKAFTSDLKGVEAFCAGNIIKYVLRHKKKNGIEDLKKAEWYLNKLIEIEEEK